MCWLISFDAMLVAPMWLYEQDRSILQAVRGGCTGLAPDVVDRTTDSTGGRCLMPLPWS
jgi:hypothetical protein